MSKCSYLKEEPIKNKYFVWYHNIILKAKCKVRIKGQGIYYENHHIIPRCQGGSNNKSNLVLLLGKEHFMCHYYLTKIYPDNDKLSFALWGMCNQTNNPCHERDYIIESKIYEEAKEKHAKAVSKKLKGKKTGPRSKEIKTKISISLMGRECSKETRDKISNSNKGKPKSEEHKRNMSKGQTGKKLTEDHKKNIGLGNIGRECSKETRDKISEQLKGRKTYHNAMGKQAQFHDNDPRIKEGGWELGNLMKGIRKSKEVRLKMSKNRKGKKFYNKNNICILCLDNDERLKEGGWELGRLARK